MSTIVIMPGGFHPFHAGHMALYDSARKAFPNAQVFVAATNDTSARPFPFAIKEKLAKLAGVQPGHFVQVKSPFRAEEITSQFNPEKDRLIFVRSEKDADKQPLAGGVKKDGSPAYLQPLAGQTNIAPFSKHAYMAYLPTVEFGPGMTSATEIRNAWPNLNEKRKTALVMSLYPQTRQNPPLAANVVKMLDTAIGAGITESGMLGHVMFRSKPPKLKKIQPAVSRTKDFMKKDFSLSEFAIPGGDGAYQMQPQQGVAEGSLNEFAPPGSNDGDDGFSEETLKRLAAQWYNSDEDPRVERTLMAAGWEIGQDEGYEDEPGVFVVQAGDVNGNSYLSWSAHELKQGVAEGSGQDAWAAGYKAFHDDVTKCPYTPGSEEASQWNLGWESAQARGWNKEGVAEGLNDTIYPNAEVIKSKNGKPVGEIYQDNDGWGCFHYKADRGYDMIDSREDAIQALKDLHSETTRHRPDYTIKGVAEGSNGYRVTWTEAGQKSTTGLLLKPGALKIAQKLKQKPGASDVKVVPYRDVSEGEVVPFKKPAPHIPGYVASGTTYFMDKYGKKAIQKLGIKIISISGPNNDADAADKSAQEYGHDADVREYYIEATPEQVQKLDAYLYQAAEMSGDEEAYGGTYPANDFNSMNEGEGDPEGLPHLTPELASHIRDQIDTEGPHAIVKSVTWGDGASEELTQLIQKTLNDYAEGLDENQGWAATFTNEETGQMAGTPATTGMTARYQQRENQPVAEKKGTKFRDPELLRTKQFAKMHYPTYDPDTAFEKWVQRSLKHSEAEDTQQDKTLARLAAKVDMLNKKVSSFQKADYVEESSRKK